MTQAAQRTSGWVKLLRAVHAEAAKRDLDHDALHAQAVERFGVDSIAVLTEQQLRELFRGLAGRPYRAKHPGVRGNERRQAAGTAGRNKGQAADGGKEVVHLATTADVQLCYDAAYAIGWDQERLISFIRRQLKGKEQIRTLAECNKVLWPLKAMGRRVSRQDAKPAKNGKERAHS